MFCFPYLANGQPFKLLGITYLVGKIKFKLFFQGPLLSKVINGVNFHPLEAGLFDPYKPIYRGFKPSFISGVWSHLLPSNSRLSIDPLGWLYMLHTWIQLMYLDVPGS